jgi:site-specific recombinase XerD
VVKKLQRLRALFRFALERNWIEANSAAKPKNPVVKLAPNDSGSCSRTAQNNAKRVRALVLLLRYSGLRICDAAALEVDKISSDRLFLYTHKTDEPVYCKLPSFIITALET